MGGLTIAPVQSFCFFPPSSLSQSLQSSVSPGQYLCFSSCCPLGSVRLGRVGHDVGGGSSKMGISVVR